VVVILFVQVFAIAVAYTRSVTLKHDFPLLMCVVTVCRIYLSYHTELQVMVGASLGIVLGVGWWFFVSKVFPIKCMNVCVFGSFSLHSHLRAPLYRS
jgi:hypothetical protein